MRRKPILIHCDNCGVAFYRHQCHIAEHNFCSRVCQLEWQHANQPWDEKLRRQRIGQGNKKAYKEGRRQPLNPKGEPLPVHMVAKMKGRVPWNKGLSKDTDTRIRTFAKKLKGRHRLPETIAKNRQARLANWRNPEYVSKQMVARNLKPNNTELKLLSLLEVFGFGYVGDGHDKKFIIGGKCPDYSNYDHKLIELFGDYWHQGENPQDKIDHYKKYGFDCLIIWEHELKKLPSVEQKVRRFAL